MGMFIGSRREWTESDGASWSISSKSDPRWNASGRCESSIFAISKACEEAIEAKKKALGEEPPDDLDYGGMKD
jgi:hypothetical protein